jgi:hypothetical protein
LQPKQQRLIFAGRQLEDDKTVDYYTFNEECTIELVLALTSFYYML